MTDYSTLSDELFGLLERQRFRPPRAQIEHGVRGEMAVLRVLAVEGGSLTAGAISRMLGMTTPRIAAVLGSLEKKGLIARTSDPADRRRVVVRITQSGSAFWAERQAEIKRSLRGALERLGERDAAEFVRIYGRLVDSVGTCAACCPEKEDE